MRNFLICLKFFIKSHLTVLLLFELCRCIQLFACKEMMRDQTPVSDVLECLLRGLAYDNHIAYIALIVPVLMLGLMCCLGKFPKYLVKTSVGIMLLFYIVSFVISTSNIPYVVYQNVNMNVAAVRTLWMGAEVVSMMFSADYIGYIIFGTVIILSIILSCHKVQ